MIHSPNDPASRLSSTLLPTHLFVHPPETNLESSHTDVESNVPAPGYPGDSKPMQPPSSVPVLEK